MAARLRGRPERAQPGDPAALHLVRHHPRRARADARALASAARQRLIIRPALGLVEFIRAESLDRGPKRPDLPRIWRPWLDAVADAFQAKRASLERIRTSEHHFRTIAEAHPVPLGIVRLDDRTILHANQALADLMGLPLAEARGKDVAQFYADADQPQQLIEALQQRGAVQSFEILARRSDGTHFPASLAARVIEFEGREAIITAVVDLTLLKRAEEEIARQRDALHQSEKLNALGSMLASVAHEINNPLSVVVGYATMMRDTASDPATKDRAVRIHAAAERCARIVRTFLAMARRKPQAHEMVHLDQVIESALEIAGYGLRTTDVSVRLDLDPVLPEILADVDQLTLVLMNLIVNAQHALQSVPPPRQLEIHTRSEGGSVRLEVADNGPGIAPEFLDRIFEPFYTTKPQGVGTGFGLSVCRSVISEHGGEIAVVLRQEGGTRFSILLPAASQEPKGSLAPELPALPISGRILIVEDEAEIADLLAEMLARDGHDVLLARSGREALALLETERVDLILTDLHMPDLDGPELHRALLARWPALAGRMALMTGDVLAADLTGFLSETGLPVFEKPLDPYDLRLKVRSWLAARRGTDNASA